MKKTTKKSAKTSKTPVIKTIGEAKTSATAKALKTYTGASIPATALYMKKLDAFKNCDAICYMALDNIKQTVCYINAYGKKGSGEVQPRSSFDAATYTYPIKEKVVAKKQEEMLQIEDPTEWPSFITFSVGGWHTGSKRRGKAKAK